MELDRYLRTLVGRWYFVPILAFVGLLGTWGYLQWIGGGSWGNFRWTSPPAAVATVVVLEPAVTQALSSPQAQVTFGSIAESLVVSERVVRRLGLDISPEELQSNVSAKLSRSLVPNVSMPLYVVKVEHNDSDRVVDLCNTVVDESRLLFNQLNALDPADVDSALRREEERVRAEYAEAQVALGSFEGQNKAWNIHAQVDSQMSLVNSLRQAARFSRVGRATTTAAGADASERLAGAEQELGRLRSLLPAYERLAFEVNLAGTTVAQLAAREGDLALLDDPAVLLAVRGELAAARTRLARARNALQDFQAANDVSDLPAELEAQAALVGELRRSKTADGSAEQTGLEDVLAQEVAELERLFPLASEWDQLKARVNLAEARLTYLDSRKFDLLVTDTKPPAAQVKLIDAARLQSVLLWTMILYALGAMLGVFAALVVVYLIAYFDRTPQSLEEVQALIGAPVLVRLPNAY